MVRADEILQETSEFGTFGIKETVPSQNIYNVIVANKTNYIKNSSLDVVVEKWKFVIRLIKKYPDATLLDGGFNTCIYCKMYYNEYMKVCSRKCPLVLSKNCCLAIHSSYVQFTNKVCVETAQSMLNAILDAG